MARQKATIEDHIEDVEALSDQIRTELAETNTAWWKVAELFAEAAKSFRLSSEPMAELLRRVEIKKSKASKLVAIANSERLQLHRERFARVPSWTVLYEVARLEDEAFERLISHNEPVTVALIDEARGKIPRTKKSQKLLFEVLVDKEAVLSSDFTDKTYADFLKKLEALVAEYDGLTLADKSPFRKHLTSKQGDEADVQQKILNSFKR